MLVDVALPALFLSAFVSSTILPGTSEVALVALLVNDPSRLAPAIAAATAGNTLGGMTSYAIGRFLPASTTPSRGLAIARRHGAPVLLLSWLPVIGDALCIASGWLRHDLWQATVFIALGKLARYGVVAYATLALR